MTDILYAWSEDGGKTIQRGEGSKIEWPIRAEAGPHQGDIVYREDQGPPLWLHAVAPALWIDEKGRPVVAVVSYKTGKHTMVLENGKWTERRDASSQASNQPAKETGKDEDDDSENPNPFGFKLPYEIKYLDTEYLRDTGNLVYLAEVPRKFGNTKIKLVLSKPVPAKK